jgi:hypothetical protein
MMTADPLRKALLDRIRDETRVAVLEGDASDCSSADCIADAVYEIVRVALATPPALDVERLRASLVYGIERQLGPGSAIDFDSAIGSAVAKYAALAETAP